MSDPVEIVAGEIWATKSWHGERGEPSREDRVKAKALLRSLTADGWRLVRPGPCTNPDAALGECGCSGIFFAEEWTGQ